MQDPVLTILNLVSNGWDNTNTSISYDPAIHSGWHDTEANDPQVTVTHVEEGASGATGFSGIDPSGAGPTQDIDGTVAVNCWSDREVESSVNPKKLTFEFTEEVKRIVKNNTLSATDLRYISYGGRNFRPDGRADPTVFRYRVPVKYFYHERP